MLETKRVRTCTIMPHLYNVAYISMESRSSYNLLKAKENKLKRIIPFIYHLLPFFNAVKSHLSPFSIANTYVFPPPTLYQHESSCHNTVAIFFILDYNIFIYRIFEIYYQIRRIQFARILKKRQQLTHKLEQVQSNASMLVIYM